ncbi:MAG TPA: cytochrome b6-f complex subunit PetL [Trichocoleus sp.]|jgi:hypothetical protein
MAGAITLLLMVGGAAAVALTLYFGLRAVKLI